MNILSRYGRKKCPDAHAAATKQEQASAPAAVDVEAVSSPTGLEQPATVSPPQASSSGDADAVPSCPSELLFDRSRDAVLVRAPGIGEVWLVPAYTGSGRRELTYDDAAAVARVHRAFPGAHVVELTSPAEEIFTF